MQSFPFRGALRRTRIQMLCAGLVFCLCGMTPSASAETLMHASSKGMRFQVEQVAAGLGVPWGLAFLGPDALLITERGGGIRLLTPSSRTLQRITGGPEVWAFGQGGLLDVAVPPNYKRGGWIYFTYSKPQGSGSAQAATTLARAKLDGTRLVGLEDLLVTRSAADSGRHFGSRIAFDEAGHLFFSIGDRGLRPSAQNLKTHSGAILRLRLDGGVPGNNPFANRTNALPEIWSYGHRNPQGLFYDRERQWLWSNEHGPRGGDEINLIQPGRNYGWPVISYGKEYFLPLAVGEGTAKEGMEQPIKHYVPSIAPGSLIVYSGTAFPAWRGNLLSGALKLQHLNRVELDADGNAVAEERLLESLGERIRALAESLAGRLYLSTDRGRILRLRPAKAD